MIGGLEPDLFAIDIDRRRVWNQPAMTKPIEDSRAAIVAERQRWVEGSKASDLALIDSLLCDDVILMPPNESSLYGRAEACKWFADYFKRFKVLSLVGTGQEIEVNGDTAIELWSYGVSI